MPSPATVLTLLLLPLLEAVGGTITLSATDSGWYSSDGAAASPISNQNYSAGTSGGDVGGNLAFRDYFVFDLSSVTQTILSAQLRAYNPKRLQYDPGEGFPLDPQDGYLSPNATDTFDLFEVSTSPATLSARTGGLAAFDDLGTGTLYGTHVFTTADNGTIVSIPLNAAAISALNSTHGIFAFGGANVTAIIGQFDLVFAFTAGPKGGSMTNNTTRELVLETVDVPEPSTVELAGIWGAILFILRRRSIHRLS